MKANFESLYDNIGQLIYAVATEQKHLSEYDLKKLKLEVAEAWQPLTSDPQLHYTLVKHMNDAITNCYNESVPSNNAFEIFEDYYFVHSSNFGPGLQDKILAAANQISHEFFGIHKNGETSHVLKELKQLLHPHLNSEGCSCEAAIIYSYKGKHDDSGKLVLEQVK